MKITHIGPGAIDAYKAQQEQNKQVRKKKEVPEQDRAEISSKGRELQAYRAALRQMPDVRQDKVEEIKHRIKSGTFAASAEKTAAGIIRELRGNPPNGE